jgi:hypothetical protein
LSKVLIKFNKWVADGRKDKPPNYDSIIAALHKFGYAAYRDAQRMLKKDLSLLGGSGPWLKAPDKP